MPRCTALLVMLVVGASRASAQGTATYSFAFGSPTGPSTWFGLSPGQTLSVYVNVTLSPGVGAPIGTPPAPVWGLANGAFGISWSAGSLGDLRLDPPYDFPGGTSAGVVNGHTVNAVLWGMGALSQWPHPSPSTTDTVWSATFTAGSLPSSVFTFTGFHETGVYFGAPGGVPGVATYTSIGTPGYIIHIPSPAAAFVVLGGLFGRIRRSR